MTTFSSRFSVLKRMIALLILPEFLVLSYALDVFRTLPRRFQAIPFVDSVDSVPVFSFSPRPPPSPS